MKTENLSHALDNYESLIADVLPSSEDLEGLSLAQRAQQELSELTRLVDVVKGFIEHNDITTQGKVLTMDVDEMQWVITEICDIVGYKD